VHTIDVNGATIAYTDTGAPPDRPDAETIVFGHGLLFSGWMFSAQIETLRKKYRCIAIDWRGQGHTPAASGGYDMDTLTDDAMAVIKALDVAPVHWVGLSMGGFVGQRIAARHGELLRSLTLLDTSSGPEDPDHVGKYKLLALVLRLVGPKPLRSQVVPILFGKSYLADPANNPTVSEFIRRLNKCDRAGVRKAVLGVCDRAPIDDEIPNITVPTLVAVGAEDVATPVAKSERIASRIPGSRLEIIQGAGHSSTIEQPAAVTALLKEFLAAV
jgi:pimeloyl-ACP methyl ester carboxylesterase